MKKYKVLAEKIHENGHDYKKGEILITEPYRAEQLGLSEGKLEEVPEEVTEEVVDRNEDLHKLNQALSDAIDIGKEALQKAEESLKVSESDKQALQTENDNQAKEINALNGRLGELAAEFNGTKEALQKELEAKEKQLAAAQAEIKALKSDPDKGTKKK